jgi:CheY-like chemotaxis protein
MGESMNDVKIILLAEDNPKDVELTLEALDEYKLANKVVTVKDGVEAMEFLRCTGKYANRKPIHPVVIVLDIKMPRMNGIEVLQEVKKDPVLKTIPVVILTSSREEKDLCDTYNLGVNAYVVKPVDFHDFIEAVRSLGVFWVVVNERPTNCLE